MGRDKKRMVFVVTASMALGFLRGQFQHWCDEGFEVCVMSANGDELERISENTDVQAIPIPFSRKLRPIRDVICLAKLYWHLKGLDPAIVNVGTPKASLLTLGIGRIATTATFVFTVHGLISDGWTGWKQRVGRYVEGMLCRRADIVVAVSPSLETRIKDKLRVNKEKVRSLHNGSCNGIDASYYNLERHRAPGSELREQVGVKANDVVFGFVGRVTRDKGIFDLMSVWSQLGDKRYWLFVVGPDEEGIIEDGRFPVDSYGKVKYLGYVNEMGPVYAAIDVVVVPSYREGFGYSLLEAAAMKRPVVAYAITGCVDVVETGCTGVLVAPGNRDELREAMEKLGDDKRRREALGRTAARRAREKFDQIEVWRAWKEVYDDALEV